MSKRGKLIERKHKRKQRSDKKIQEAREGLGSAQRMSGPGSNPVTHAHKVG